MKSKAGKCTGAVGRLPRAAMLVMAVGVLAGCSSKGTPAGTEAATEQGSAEAEAARSQSQDGVVAQETSGSSEGAPASGGAGETLTVVASPGAHTDILRMAQTILSSEGISLVIDSDFDDYLMPNILVDSGTYDCNYFQHEEYLNVFNAEQGTDLVSVGKIHFEPLGIYPGKKRKIDDLASGDVITIPQDTANQARALQLLSDAGILELNQAKKYEATINDVTANPKGVELQLMDASQVPAAVAASAFVVMNGNYARQALYTVTTDAIAYENPSSSVAERYANIIAVNRGNENDPRVQKLVAALQSQEIRTYIESRFAGAVVPYTGS